jgi:hypothetical protein
MVKSLVVQMERDLPAETTMANPYIKPFAKNDLMVNQGHCAHPPHLRRLYGATEKIK